jgi:hypothetical protein
MFPEIFQQLHLNWFLLSYRARLDNYADSEIDHAEVLDRNEKPSSIHTPEMECEFQGEKKYWLVDASYKSPLFGTEKSAQHARQAILEFRLPSPSCWISKS